MRAGLKCELVLTRRVPRYDDDYLENGNILLDSLLGAHVHDLPGSADALAFAEERAQALRAQGHNVYVCPLGGSSPAGCLGYASCAFEIAQQCEASGLSFDHVLVPNGSGGMQAGLVAGFLALGQSASSITGYAVLSEAAHSLAVTLEKANATARMIDATLSVPDDAVIIDGAHLGEGYGIPTDGMREAVRTLASTEGLLLDPVYGGKAFAGLLHDVKAGRYRRGQRLLFVMTGGLPGLFAYRSTF